MKTNYSYEIWMGGCMLCQGDGFESEEEATEGATTQIEDIIDDWKIENAYGGETANDFDITIKDYEVEEDEW